MRAYLPALLLIIATSTAVLADCDEITPLDVNNRTDIRATVVGITLYSFPLAKLDLMIKSSTNPRILELNPKTQTLTATTYFWTSLGKVDFFDPRNIGSISAYYLLQGDEIRAKLFAGSQLRDRWYVYSVSRIKLSLSREGPAVKEFDGLELVLELEREVYNVGDPVPLTLKVTNTTDKPKTLSFSSGQRYDFVITRAGREIWRWSAGKAFIQSQALGSITLQPNETLEYHETWRQVDNEQRHVPAGEYDIKGILTSEKPRTVGPATIVIQNLETTID